MTSRAEGRSSDPFDDGSNVLQRSTGTSQERYPWIFDGLAQACPEAKRVLSYG